MMVLYVAYPEHVLTAGFPTAMRAAAFVLHHAPPGWIRAGASTFNNEAEVLDVLSTAEQQTRFLAGLGYTREEVLETVCEKFPDEPLDALNTAYNDAVRILAESDAKLDELIAEENKRTVASEHDLSQTMHDTQEGTDA